MTQTAQNILLHTPWLAQWNTTCLLWEAFSHTPVNMRILVINKYETSTSIYSQILTHTVDLIGPTQRSTKVQQRNTWYEQSYISWVSGDDGTMRFTHLWYLYTRDVYALTHCLFKQLLGQCWLALQFLFQVEAMPVRFVVWFLRSDTEEMTEQFVKLRSLGFFYFQSAVSQHSWRCGTSKSWK